MMKTKFTQALLSLDDFSDNVSGLALREVLEGQSFSQIMDRFTDYLDFLRNENGSLSSFWM